MGDERAERDVMIHRLAGLPRKQRAAVVLRYYAGNRDRRSAGLPSPDCAQPDLRALATRRIDLTANRLSYNDTFAELERRAAASEPAIRRRS